MTQAVYDYSYGSDVPLNIRLGCTAGNISLLNAEQCLFYRYNQLGWIKYIWAVGLLAAGQSSTMTVSDPPSPLQLGVEIFSTSTPCRVHMLDSLLWR